MAIVMTLTESNFVDYFKRVRPEQFSREALGMIFDYYDSADWGTDIEFDPIAICCEWEESSAWELINQYDIDIDEGIEGKEAVEQAVNDYMQDNTCVLGQTLEGNFVYIQF